MCTDRSESARANRSRTALAGVAVAAANACAWCGAGLSPSRRLHGRKRCERCGVATTDPRPTEAELDRAYSRYRPATGRFAGPGDALLRRTRAQLATRIDRLAPRGPVLDVGAGDGTLLDALHARGREALGLERHVRRDDVVDADLRELDRRWSAIVFWHSLEHLPAPGRTIDSAAELLLPGGILLVAVPNAASLQATVFGDRWFHLDLPRHLVHLTANALTERLSALGLEVTRVSHWRGGQALFGWLHGLVGVLPGRPDLYDAIRRPEARSAPMAAGQRIVALGTATAMLPIATAATALEIAARRGGSVYVEARRG
jgi:SAM-dependent methyltransferase